MSTIQIKRNISVKESYDVIVAGAGPAGICAAVAAARMGSRVALIERYGVIGGNLTVGHVGPVLGMVGKGTMREELMERLAVPQNDMIGISGVAHDVELAKRVLAEFVEHEKITVYLQCMVCDVMMEEKRITGVVLSSKEGTFAVPGKVVVDATGDGDVAYYCGAEYEKGRDDGLMQPVTLEFTLSGVDESKAIVCIGDVDDVELDGQRFLDYCAQCAEKGLLPEHLAAVRLHRTTRPGERQVNTTQMNRVDSTKPGILYQAEVELRRQIEVCFSFSEKSCPAMRTVTVRPAAVRLACVRAAESWAIIRLQQRSWPQESGLRMLWYTRRNLLWISIIRTVQDRQKKRFSIQNRMICRIAAFCRAK